MIFFIFSILFLMGNARIVLTKLEERYTVYSLNDPILSLIKEPIDCNVLLSLIQTSAIVLAFFFESFQNVENILVCFSFVHIVRDITLFLVPLSPPKNTIYLEDKFITLFFTPEQILTKDLFFSGHTSFLFLIFWFSNNLFWLQLIFFILTILFLILQKVHYTIDIFIAPFICYCVVSFCRHFSII